MRGKLFLSLSSAALVASLIAAANAAGPATPAEMQKARHDHYHELGDAFKEVRDQSKAASPDFAALEKAAEVVNKASIDQQQWFTKGTGIEAGKTRALPEIWSKPEDFTAAQKMFSDRAPKLLAAAKAKDVAGVQAAFKEVGGACKNCHDTFRAPEEH
jgi:cytochrome c556